MKRKFNRPVLTLFFAMLLACAGQVLGQETGQDAVIRLDLDAVNLRAAPSVESTVLAIMPGGTPLSVMRLSPDSQWLYVMTDELAVGWVFRELATFTHGDADVILDGRAHLAPEVVERVAEIYARGRAFGLRGDTFAKVGDSLSVADQWLKPIAEGYVQVAEFDYLEGVIERFSGESFARASLAAGVGWTAYAALTPSFANADECVAHESPLLCEYRIMQPAVALILFGSNDVGILDPSEYNYNMRRILDLTTARGIVPILSTIPLRIGFEERVDEFNQIVRGLAAEYRLPLIDTYAAMWMLPGHGLDEDGVHPNVPPKGFQGAVDFRAENLYYGHVIRNLTTLQMLDAVREVMEA